MQDFVYRHKKMMATTLVAVLLLIVGISVFYIIRNNIYSAKVNMIVAPTIAKVRIGDEVFDAMGEYNIKPGEYMVEVSADGFYPKTGSLVAIGGETVNVSVFLEPTDENSNWYSTHQEDGLIMGEIKNNMTVEALRQLGEKYPIINILPYSAEYFIDNYSTKVKYVVSYRTDSEDTDLTITITDYMGGAEQVALDWLAENGVTSEKYVIEYRDISTEWMITGSAE